MAASTSVRAVVTALAGKNDRSSDRHSRTRDGLLDAATLPVAGGESAEKVPHPTSPANRLMERAGSLG
jgi:hypothetical protein